MGESIIADKKVPLIKQEVDAMSVKLNQLLDDYDKLSEMKKDQYLDELLKELDLLL